MKRRLGPLAVICALSSGLVVAVVAPGEAGGATAVASAQRTSAVHHASTAARSAKHATKYSLVLGAPVADGTGRLLTPATAMLTPARRGQVVKLYRFAGGRWHYAKSARQNAQGIARFSTSAGTTTSPYVYRAVAATTRRHAVASTPARSMRLSRTAFDDEFSGTTLSSKWQARLSDFTPVTPCSKALDHMVTVGHGVATLQVRSLGRKAGCRYGAWANPIITTGFLDRPYGYYAARVKFGKNRGMHGAFWLQGGTEMDVVEHFGYHRPISNLLHSGLENTGKSVGGDRARSRTILGRSTPYTGYHTYSVQWSPAGYVFRLDGVPTLASTQKKTKHPAEIILSLATGSWELPALNPRTVTAPSSSMQVDWVRAWQ